MEINSLLNYMFEKNVFLSIQCLCNYVIYEKPCVFFVKFNAIFWWYYYKNSFLSYLLNITVDAFYDITMEDLYCWHQSVTMWLKWTLKTKDRRFSFVNHKRALSRRWESRSRYFKKSFWYGCRIWFQCYSSFTKNALVFAFFVENAIKQKLHNIRT